MARKTETASPSYIAMVVSQKGGAGKSFAAGALLDFLRSNGLTIAAYDGDGDNGMLVKLHGSKDADGRTDMNQDAKSGVDYFDLAKEDERRQLFNIANGIDDKILVDLPGGPRAAMSQLFDAGEGLARFFSGYGERGYRVVLIHLLTTDAESVESIATFLDDTEDPDFDFSHVQHIVLINRKHAKKNEAFRAWFGAPDFETGERKGGKTRERFLAAGGVEVVLPELDAVTNSIVKELRLPYSVAEKDARLQSIEQQQVTHFRRDLARNMEPVKAIFGL